MTGIRNDEIPWLWLGMTYVITSQREIYQNNQKCEICVTVLGSPCYLTWLPDDGRQAIGLGYRCYASTHPLKCIANGGPQGKHLNPPSNGALAPVRVPAHVHPTQFFYKSGACRTSGLTFWLAVC